MKNIVLTLILCSICLLCIGCKEKNKNFLNASPDTTEMEDTLDSPKQETTIEIPPADSNARHMYIVTPKNDKEKIELVAPKDEVGYMFSDFDFDDIYITVYYKLFCYTPFSVFVQEVRERDHDWETTCLLSDVISEDEFKKIFDNTFVKCTDTHDQDARTVFEFSDKNNVVFCVYFFNLGNSAADFFLNDVYYENDIRLAEFSKRVLKYMIEKSGNKANPWDKE